MLVLQLQLGTILLLSILKMLLTDGFLLMVGMEILVVLIRVSISESLVAVVG